MIMFQPFISCERFFFIPFLPILFPTLQQPWSVYPSWHIFAEQNRLQLHVTTQQVVTKSATFRWRTPVPEHVLYCLGTGV